MKNNHFCTRGVVEILRRLRRSKAGNTLAMVAAGLVPLTAMIGSGVDMSRAYMVQSRLQQACDAGVLAGRKAMADGDYTSAAQGVAEDYFDVNFPTDYLDTTNRSFTTSNPSGGSTVVGNASVRVPTVVMSMFSIDDLNISVACTAQLEISNSDITFVLDTTGSMACPENADTTQCQGYINTHGVVEGRSYSSLSTTSRMQALKDAMDGFYGVIDTAAASSGARIRYAFVPYAQTVNVGYLLPPSYIVDEHAYESMERVWVEEDVTEYFRSRDSRYTSNCSGFYGSWPGFRVYGRYDASYGGCIWDHDFGSFWQNRFQEVIHDTDVYKTGTPVRDPTGRTSNDFTWAGCIEERDTVGSSSITFNAGSSTFSPAGLHDLDIDSAPTSDATKWRPYWPEIVFRRSYNTTSSTSASFPQVNCPYNSELLAEYTTLNDFQTYHGNLSPDGGTYHDIGLTWGARLSSPDGIFSSNVNEAPSNSGYVGRHLIWMTDGVLDPSDSAYASHGVERHDGRITGVTTGTNSAAYASHATNRTTRYKEMCKAIKAKGIRLWVVAFNTALTTDLTECASANSSFVANNATELGQRFAAIAEQIAELRLTE
ncbi:MAG: TadE/TadG family type IV pilus assembly protein [Pseudomonadota bacterium]